MGDLKTRSYLLFLAFMLLVTTFLPIVSAYSRFNIGVTKYWVYLWFISLIFFYPRTLTDRFFFYVLCFSIVFAYFLLNTIWIDLPGPHKKMETDSIFGILVSLSLYKYFNYSKDYDGLAMLVKWTLIFITITAILTIYSSTIDPLYARKLVGGEYTLEEAKAFGKRGGGWYGFAGTLMCLFPMIIYYYRNNSKIPFSKPLILIFGILCFVALLKMQIFANIIISVLAIIFSLFGSRRIRRSLIYVGIILTLLILTPKNVYSDLLIGASRYFKPESDVYYKLNDMAVFVKLGEVSAETAAGGRVERYPLLWKGFKVNPIVGFYNSGSALDISAGFHIYWMYKLTSYGFLFFILFVLIFYIHFKNCIRHFDKEFTFYFLLSVISGIGLGLMKNLVGNDFWCMLFFIIPSLYYLPLLKKKTSDIEK